MVVLDRVAGPDRCARVPAREWSRPARAAPPPAARSRCRSDRPSRRRGLPAPGKSGGRRARRSARSCPRSTGNSAARGSAICPEYIGERCTLARMIAWVAAVVRVMPHSICGCARSRRSGTRTAPAARRRAASPAPPSRWCAPSSRGGVPVFSRPSAKPSRSSVSDRPIAGASPTRPAGICCSPIWMRPRRNVPVVSTTAPAADDSGHPPRRDAGTRRHRSIEQIVGLALDHRRGSRSRGIAACIAAA